MLKPMATILIVEDDALLQDALTGQLKQLNYGVCTATSVAQGMAVLQDQAVDGIILDLGLPDADGLDLLTWARTRIVGLPVLILTARDGIDDRVRGLNAGADDYLTKPFNMQELQARLQAMLRRARQPAFTQATSAQGGPSTTIGNAAGLAIGQDLANGRSAVIDDEDATFAADRDAGAGRFEILPRFAAATVRANDRDPAGDVGNDVSAVEGLNCADRRLQSGNDRFQLALGVHDKNLVGSPVGDQQTSGAIKTQTSRGGQARDVHTANAGGREAIDLIS